MITQEDIDEHRTDAYITCPEHCWCWDAQVIKKWNYSKNKKCIDCKVLIANKSTRCEKHAQQNRWKDERFKDTDKSTG